MLRECVRFEVVLVERSTLKVGALLQLVYIVKVGTHFDSRKVVDKGSTLVSVQG